MRLPAQLPGCMAALRRCGLALVLALAPLPVAAQPVDMAGLRAAVQSGDPAAQFRLAEIYRQGLGVPQSYARAAELYQLAAEQDHPGALNGLAGLYANGLGVARDEERAYDLVSRAAASGLPEYLHNLGAVTENGIGTAPDPAAAAGFYQQAADLGWLPSQVALGVLYQEGKGVAEDIPKALDLYRAAADAGDARAQNNTGLIYARGEGGVAQDHARAVEWYSKAAEQGLPDAIRNLAVMYQNGFGVAPDEEQAARLNRIAALSAGVTADIQGDAAGLPLLFDPRLKPPDAAQVPAYRAAAQAGDPVALFLLGYVTANAAQNSAGYREAAALFRRAADSGSHAAMANLGIMIFEGRGVLQDYVEGYKWLSLAAVGGLPGAVRMRDALAERMTPGQINAANALAEREWTDAALPAR